MTNHKIKKSRPQHPFPRLAHGFVSDAPLKLSRAHERMLKWISQGARVMFDIKAKRALIYTFDRGFKTISEITVRCLAALVRSGQLAFMAKQDHLVHYARQGANSAWYQPEA